MVTPYARMLRRHLEDHAQFTLGLGWSRMAGDGAVIPFQERDQVSLRAR